MRIYHSISRLYTPTGTSALTGVDMRRVNLREHVAIAVNNHGRIAGVGSVAELERRFGSPAEKLDCRGLTALPGFVDSHTHLVFMGERSMEFGMRASGKSYQEIAEAGGGIRSTVDKVGTATTTDIAENARKFALSALMLGTTTVEIKSGYGLTTESELRLLQAADILRRTTPLETVITYLGAHAVPRGKSKSEYLEEVLSDQLPAVRAQGLAAFADVFCDEGYFTNEETERICNEAARLGFRVRLHADELAETGGAALAVKLGAYSADHLLKISDQGIAELAASKGKTVATLLPVTALSIRQPFAPARKLIDAGAAVAVATDCNPGSSMSENMQLVVSLSVIGMGMTVEEALTAATLNGAAALGIAASHGSIEEGKVADFVLYDIPALAYLPYHIGVSDIVTVVKKGEIVMGEIL